jgi:UMF1 family MFS transporter
MNAHESGQTDLSGPREPSARRAFGSTPDLVSWAFYDWGSSAFATIIQTFVFAAYFTRHVAENETVGSVQWGNMLSAAAIVVAIGGPILGAMADQAGRRKPWVAGFTALCVSATALLWFVRPSLDYVWLAMLLVWLATIGEEFAAIFYNAMLPDLTGPDRLGRWSGWGWSLGYAGGLVSLVVALFAFVKTDDPWFSLDRTTAEHVRATFLLVAVWYLLFAMPFFLVTPDSRGTGKGLARAARDGLRQLSGTIRQVRSYGDILRFLIARMIYIDGLATVFAFGGVYAAGTFDMTEEEVLIFGIALNVTAGIGAALFAWVDDWIGSKPTILLSLVGLMVPGTLILFVQSPKLFWAFGLLLGVFVGPVQAASRSFLARVAPAPLLTEMFGLYALSGKATAFLGPLLVGWLTYLSGSQRIGMGTVILFFFLGFLLMITVPPDRQR